MFSIELYRTDFSYIVRHMSFSHLNAQYRFASIFGLPYYLILQKYMYISTLWTVLQFIAARMHRYGRKWE